MTHAFCSGCLCVEPVDRNWRALWIDSDGNLLTTAPEHGCNLDFERPNTVFACGETAVLRLTERYLHSGNFGLAHDAELATADLATLPNDLYHDLT